MNPDMALLKQAFRQALSLELTLHGGLPVPDLANYLTTKIMEVISDVVEELQTEMTQLRQENARLKTMS